MPNKSRKRLYLGLLLLFAIRGAEADPAPMPHDSAPWIGNDLSGIPCKDLGQGYGLYDYTNPDHRGKPLYLVEMVHFTRYEERLIPRRNGGIQSTVNDINYTLRAFPNHHKALYAYIRYSLMKHDYPLPNPPECYLQRAINFKPDDGTVEMLYGIYLHRRGYYRKALSHYMRAEQLHVSTGELYYNIGLLYYDMKDYRRAAIYARKAYALGYPLEGLKNKLHDLGVDM